MGRQSVASLNRRFDTRCDRARGADFEPKDASLEPISWDDFFEKFDDEGLAFLYQDRTADGAISRFHKFVNRS